MPPLVIGAAVAGAATIGGAALSASAQKKAANKAAGTAAATTAANNALARETYGKNEAHLSPFINYGTAAGAQANALLGLGGDTAAANNAFQKYLASTGYTFQRDQGLDSIATHYAGGGMFGSGAEKKALTDYASNSALGGFQNYFGNLTGQENVGLGAANALAGVSTNMVGQVTANNNSAGTAAANAALLSGSANAQMYSGIANGIGQIAGSLGSSFGSPSGANSYGIRAGSIY